MANNEGIDIIIKAQDQYTKTINNITASNELFGNSLKNNEKELAAVTKLMVTMRVQGIEPTDAAMVKLKADYDRLSQSLNSGEGAVKKTNMQFTNLALVIQDLPYGFRGIQNNLPALLGSIAGVGGAAYLAFSALVALYTAFGDQINDAILKTTNFEKAQKELGKSTIEAAKSTETARTEILKVTSVVQAAKDGFVDKSAALQFYNEKLGDSFGKVTTLGEAEQALVDKAPKYIEALMLKAKAEFYFAKASEYAVKKDIAGLEDQTSALDKLLITANTVAKFADVSGVKGIIKTLVEGIGQAQNEGVAKVTKTAGTIADVLTEEGKKSMSAYFKALKDSGLTDADIQSIIDKLNQKLLKTQLKGNQDRLKAVETANDAEVKAFVSTLDERGKKEYEAGLKLAKNLEVMRAAGYTDSTTYYAAYRAEIDNIATFYNNKELAEAQKIADKVASIQLDMRFKMASALTNINEKFASEDVKNNNIRLNATLKATRGNYQAQKAAIEEAIAVNNAYKLSAEEAGYGTEVFTAAGKNLESQLDGLVDPLETLNQSLQNAFNQLDLDLLVNFGEQIGNMLAGGKFDISQMGTILADALSSIGRALIAYALTNGAVVELFKNPKTWPLALAAGIAAVAAGTALKSKINNNKATAFANGGIVSGPTMGLVGEYPGAQNNPEVIAPLDKLKDMIGGGGGGTFVLRGQDLLLSVNRAQKASNLKGQNISLA
jgi:hypothetical protein